MEKINVAELLKDCPKGMELDCTIFDDVTLDCVTKNGVYIRLNKEKICELSKFGNFIGFENSKCIIFPKGKTTWEGFVPPCKFEDGDIVFSGVSLISIFKGIKEGYVGSLYSYVSVGENVGFNIDKDCWTLNNIRLATEEEKARLFQAIKDNGYKWNEETKTLEKLQKFKVGDKVKRKEVNYTYIVTIVGIDEEYYTYVNQNGEPASISVKNQDDWELVPNKFDISTLVPFESRVLVRNDESQYWIPAFWGYKRDDGYTTTFGWSKYCVPYEGNEHLLDKTDDCDEYYKTWE